MLKNSGLVSISFRGKCVNEIIRLSAENSLKYIEWGGDVHCPAGDISRARELGHLTKNAGLIPFCYGSYYRVGVNPVSEFQSVCETAKALGATVIRVWAYNKSYEACTSEELCRVISEAKEIFNIAKANDLCINFEYHRSTLTQTIDGALRLFSELDKDILFVSWQPNPEITVDEHMRELSLLPRLDIVHTFAWTFENGENVRHPLYNHHLTWKDYIKKAKEINPDCIFELEFFKDDSEEQMSQDCRTLNDLL
ncbi:MAG: sugar phosphate isomerase/epimerase [Clostridia bacterium]|nr:sugar phosphate isomerase/epimerase [Clostridia bacterium]